MSIFQFLITPLILFLVIVAPIWLVMHYRHKGRVTTSELSDEDSDVARRMTLLMEKMENRISTLEKILDADDPRWREKGNPSNPL